MSFFMVLNGQFNQHQFDYLNQNGFQRLDKTLAHGEKRQPTLHHCEKRLFAFEIMSRHVLTLKPTDGLDEAKTLLQKHRIHHIPIVGEKKNLIGLLSDRDLLKLEENKLFNLIEIKEIMSHIVVACTFDTDAREVAKVLVREQISAMPVVDESRKLIGIVSRVDVLKAVVDQKFKFD
ncbi:MAG: hypothetical protein OHK0056_20890 [Bacteriovoracaceae bacterium]